jgi:cellulose biosynthesis protein BcsQ
VVAPLQAEPLALRAFAQVLRVIEHVQRHENPDLRLLGILPTMVRLDRDTSLNVMGTVWSQLGGVLDTCIPRADVFDTASELGLPVSFLAGRTPPEARRFALLAREVENLIEELTGEEEAVDATMHRQLI